MAQYSTQLSTWGDTGSAYPSGYSVLEGEQPVDAWENFAKYNIIEDLKHLISLTNGRIESDTGPTGSEPSSPEASHLFHNTDTQELSLWDGTASTWRRLLKANNGVLEGALDFAGFNAENVGNITAQDGTTIWNGSEISSSLIQSAGLDADTVDGIEASELGSGASDSGTLVLNTATDFNFGTNLQVSDDGDGTVTINAQVPDADLTDISEDGTQVLANAADINFTGHLNVINDGDGSVTIDPTHNHDSRYDNYGSWTLQEGNGSETSTITSGETLTIYGGNDIYTEMVSGDLQINHEDTSSQSDVNTSGGSIIDYINLDGNGHVTGMGTRNLDSRYYTESEADSLFAASGHNHDSRYIKDNGDSFTGYLDGRNASRIGVPTYTSTSDLPSGNPGDIAYVSGDNQLYVYN
jgi:hypothetical protein